MSTFRSQSLKEDLQRKLLELFLAVRPEKGLELMPEMISTELESLSAPLSCSIVSTSDSVKGEWKMFDMHVVEDTLRKADGESIVR